MASDFVPIRSRAQFPPGEGPRVFMAHKSVLAILSGQFTFHHHDLCLFHQAIYASIRGREAALDSYVEQHRSILATDMSIEDDAAIVQSRIREAIYASELEMQSIVGFADQLLIVGLWSTVEQYCSRALVLSEKELTSSTVKPAPYKWVELEKRYKSLGLEITQCEGYQDVNECRVLNNKIKHSGEVDAELAAFPAFAGMEGSPLSRVRFALQRYSDAVFEFVGHVLESMDDLLVLRRNSLTGPQQ